eukprot:TRINITY_DN1649_c0_g2_i19.p1 TRINITY_DN1649_c0_g2~~TRINITY_DN1649_c0_g2_i19.p1  ORF type:complete len:386 (+),score=24.66 TRINITY_DN1649_c0_g2_i19:102-1259(+)
MEKRGGAVDWKTGMGDLDVDDHLPAHLADHQGAEESPAARTSPQVPWLLNSKRPAITRARCCAAIGVPIGVVFVVAIVTGLSINHVYTGDAWNGGRGQVPFPDPDNLDVQGSTEITLNALVQGSVCAAVASGMALVRFGFRNYTHPRVYGVFSFVSYVILLLVLLYQVYDGTDVTVLTNSQANAFANQIYNFLGGTFNWEDAKFATTFRDIVQVSDFWAFMRGPFHDFLLGSALNRLSASDSAERTTRIPINAPAMTNVQFNAVNDHNTRLGMVPWIVSYCNMRQVVRQPEVIDVPSLLGTQIVGPCSGVTALNEWGRGWRLSRASSWKNRPKSALCCRNCTRPRTSAFMHFLGRSRMHSARVSTHGMWLARHGSAIPVSGYILG